MKNQRQVTTDGERSRRIDERFKIVGPLGSRDNHVDNFALKPLTNLSVRDIGPVLP